MTRSTLSWDALEYHHFERSADWFWSLGIIAITIAILGFLFNDVLFSIFVLVAAVTAGLYANRKPEVIHVELQPRGVLIDKLFYPYNNLQSFFVDEHHHHHPRLVLQSKKTFMPHTVILIDHYSALEIHNYLIQHLPEVKHQDNVLHMILEYFGL